MFQGINRLSSLPDCDALISNTTIFYPDDTGSTAVQCSTFPLVEDGNTASPTNSSSSAITHPFTNIYQCPSPLVKNLSPNNSTMNCVGACCFKCPLLDNFYPVVKFLFHYDYLLFLYNTITIVFVEFF